MELEQVGIDAVWLGALAEVAGDRTRARAALEEVVSRIVGPGRLLLPEPSPTLEHVPVEERRAHALGQRQELAVAADDDLASAMFRGVTDGLCDDTWLVDRRNRHGLHAKLRTRPVEQRRVRRRGQDEDDVDPGLLVGELETQCLAEACHAVLR